MNFTPQIEHCVAYILFFFFLYFLYFPNKKKYKLEHNHDLNLFVKHSALGDGGIWGQKIKDAVFFLGLILVNPENFISKLPLASQWGDRVKENARNILAIIYVMF